MIKKIIIAIVSLIVLLIVAVGIFLLTFDLNHYREFTEKKLSLILNRPVQIGAIHTKLSLSPTIEILNFKILEGNESHKTILEVPSMDVNLELIPLIRDFNFDIKKIDTMFISVNLDSLLTKNSSASNKSESLTNIKKTFLDNFWIKDIAVKKALLRFSIKNEKQAIEFENLTLKELNHFKFKALYQKKNVDIEGSFGSLKSIISNPNSLPINLKIKQGNATTTLKGQIGDLKNMKKIRINVSSEILKLSSFLKAWQISAPAITDIATTFKFQLDGSTEKMWINNVDINFAKSALLVSASGEAINLNKKPQILLKTNIQLKEGIISKNLNLKPFDMTTNLTFKPTSLNIEDINFRTGHSDFSGNIQIDWKNKIKFTPNLKSSYFDIKDILLDMNFSNQSQKNKKKYNTKKQKTIWNFLNNFDMSGKLIVEHLFLTNLITDYVAINISPTVSEGNLSAVFSGKILQGFFEGDLNLKSNNHMLNLEINGNDLNLDKIRSVYSKIRGAHVNTQLSLNANGNNFNDLLSSSNGRFSLEFIGGTIVDPWFNSLPVILNSSKRNTDGLDFTTSDKKTKIVCGAINVPIENGLITSNENIVLQTEPLDIAITGEINLRTKSLDIAMVPTIAKNNQKNSSQLAQLIHVSGPWHNLSFELDTKKFLMNLLQIKKIGQNNFSAPNSPYYMCQKALGRDIEKKKRTETPTKKKELVIPQKNEKRDLKNLLSQILTEK